MPNTLCHCGVQLPFFVRRDDRAPLLWAMIGCIIPDLPWMAVKALVPLAIFNPYDLRLYCTAQASFFCCLLLAAALSWCSSRRSVVFAILAGNCLAHLLLDAVEIKWGNGVHLLLPFSTEMTRFALLWPEHPLVLLGSGLGLVLLLALLFTPSAVAVTLPSKRRLAQAALPFLLYLIAPLALMGPLEKADAYALHTLRLVDERGGKAVCFDRAHYFATSRQLRTYAGEDIAVVGKLPGQSGRVSFCGRFISPSLFRAEEMYPHQDPRDLATLAGLFLACALLAQSVILPHFRSAKNIQGPP